MLTMERAAVQTVTPALTVRLKTATLVEAATLLIAGSFTPVVGQDVFVARDAQTGALKAMGLAP